MREGDLRTAATESLLDSLKRVAFGNYYTVVDIAEAPVPDTTPGVDGRTLGGRYRLMELIGQGGMADVYRAHDPVLDRMVAAKVFRAPAMDMPDGNERRRHIAEVKALAAVNHPHLTAIFDASIDSRPPYLILELIEGPSLAAELARGPLPEPAVRDMGSQIAEALAYVHARNMVHRDVKPANVLLGLDATAPGSAWRVRLSDFGIVRLLGSESMTAANLTVGSASYLAPEQARGGDVGSKADVYSLGLLLIEALTGRRCFTGSVAEVMAARLSRPPAVPMDAPPPWPGLLSAMTALDPRDRPSAVEVARALGTTPVVAGVDPMIRPGNATAAEATTLIPAEAQGVTIVSSGAADVAERERRHHRTGLLAGALLAVIVAGIVAILHSSFPGLAQPAQAPAGNPSAPAASTSRAGVKAPPSRTTTLLAGQSVPAAVQSSRPPAAVQRHPAPASTAAPAAPIGAASTPVASAPPSTSAPAPSTSPSPVDQTSSAPPPPSPSDSVSPSAP